MKLKRIINFLKYVILFFLVIFVLLLVGIFYANWKITNQTKSFLFDNAAEVPPQKVALVLGTSKYLAGRIPNPYFENRMQATKELYDAGKVKKIVVSGDNRHCSYNEPRDMKNTLINLGIPDSIIVLDYAGLRTLDSVVRLNKVFGQDSFIVVSQQFHNERAIFLAQHNGWTAYGYNAKDIALNRVSIKTVIREKFARVKVFLDIIIKKQPRFLGDPIFID